MSTADYWFTHPNSRCTADAPATAQRANRVWFSSSRKRQPDRRGRGKSHYWLIWCRSKVLRAMALFDLTRIYGKPIRQIGSSPGGAPSPPPRWNRQKSQAAASVAQCYEAIEKDLTDAINSKCTAQNQWSGLCQPLVAKALQVRVYMTKANGARLYPLAEDIISNSVLQTLGNRQNMLLHGSKSDANSFKRNHVRDFHQQQYWPTDREGYCLLICRQGWRFSWIWTCNCHKRLLTCLHPTRHPPVTTYYWQRQQGGFDPRKVYINKMPVVNGDVRYQSHCCAWSEFHFVSSRSSQAGDKNKAANLLNDIISNRTTDESKQVNQRKHTLDRIYIERRTRELVVKDSAISMLCRGETVYTPRRGRNAGRTTVWSEEARTFNRDSRKRPVDPRRWNQCQSEHRIKSGY